MRHAPVSKGKVDGGRRRTELEPRSVGSFRHTTGNQAMLRMSARRMPVPPSRLGAHESANAAQQGGGAATAPILQRQEVTQEQQAGSPAQGAAPQRTGDCSGWEADVESFTKKIAEFYVQDALGTTGHGTTIDCQGDRRMCWWQVETPGGTLKIGVSLARIPDFVIARGPDPAPRRCYDYDCPASGGVTLVPRACPP
jgi:hypothetical protein